MKIIDARSGTEMRIGDVVPHGNGEFVRLIDVDEGFLSASAVVEIGFIDHSKDVLEMPGPIVTIRREIPLTVRFFHPSFFLQKVAFIPS